MKETSEQAGRVTVKVAGFTDAGLVRKKNEDAFMIADLARTSANIGKSQIMTFEAAEHPVLLAVSDGMGGEEAGEIASALVVESLRRAMAEEKEDWDEATKAAVERANIEVWNAAAVPGRHGMGATLTAICVHGDQAHIAEVGDSRAYVIRGGRIRQITHDQSFVQILLDAGVISPEDATQHPMKNVVLQAMGQHPEVKVAVGWLELRRGDRLLLCSDGLTNKVSDEEILSMVEGDQPLDGIAKKLVDLANARGGEDNITVVVAELDGDGLTRLKKTERVTQTLHVVSEFEPPMGAKQRPPGSARVEGPVPAPPPQPAPALTAPPLSRGSIAQIEQGRVLAIAVPLIVLALVVVYMFVGR